MRLHYWLEQSKVDILYTEKSKTLEIELFVKKSTRKLLDIILKLIRIKITITANSPNGKHFVKIGRQAAVICQSCLKVKDIPKHQFFTRIRAHGLGFAILDGP